MGKKTNKKAPQPKYYSSKHLTVGMMEDVCRNIQNKSLPVLVTDSSGASPEKALKVFLLANAGKNKALAVCGQFNWTVNADSEDDDDDEEDDADVDPTEDNDMTDWERLYSGAACAANESQVDCISVDGSRLIYLGEPNDGQPQT